MYNGDDYDMRGKGMDFLSEGSDQKKIYVTGTVDDSTKGDDPYTGNVTFTFPTGTFKTPGAYDVDKTMFRVVNNDDHSVISTVNVKMTVLPNDSDVESSDDVSYDSRMEKIMKDYSDKGQASLDDAKQKAQQIIDDANKQATDYLNEVKKQGDDLLDEIKQTNSEAKGNMAGDTAATATQAKQLANDNSGKIHDLQGEVGDARGRFMTLSDRENKQDFNIDRKEDKTNANANYAAINLRDDNQDKAIAKKANQSFITDYLSQMHLEPETFENEAALKAKYSTGKAGVFVTADTGHFWIFTNNKWQDCGPYQSVGLANRSVTADKLSPLVVSGEDLLAGVNLLTALNSAIVGYGYSADNKNGFQATMVEGQAHYKISQHSGSTAYTAWTFSEAPVISISGDVALRFKYSSTLALTLEYTLVKADGSSELKTLDLGNNANGTSQVLTTVIKTDDCTGIKISSLRGTLGAVSGEAEFYDFNLFPASDLDKPYSNLKDAIDQLTSQFKAEPILKINTLPTGYVFSNDAGNSGSVEQVDNAYHYHVSQREGSTAYVTWVFDVTSDLDEPKVVSFNYRGTLKFTVEYILNKKDGTKVTKSIDANNDNDGKTHRFTFVINNDGYTSFKLNAVRGTYGAAEGDLELFDFAIANEQDEQKENAIAKLVQNQKKSYIMLNFDDATNMYKSRYELLKTYGFKFSFCLNEGFYTNKGFLDGEREQFNQMIADGNDVALYGGVGTRPDIQTCTSDQWAAYVKPLVDLCTENGIYNVTCYHSPNNAMTANGAQGLKQLGFKMARYATSPDKSLISDFTQDSFLVPTLEIQDDNLNDVTTKIDEAIDRGASLSIFTHLVQASASNEWNTSLSIYKQMLDYIKQKVDSGQIRVATWREFYASKLPQEGHENDYQRIMKMLNK